MPNFQYNTFSLQVAQDYFAHINPLAQRISSDISATKSCYGQLWCSLKPSEQNDILNETLIKPEISLKYFDSFSSSVASLSSDLSAPSVSSSSAALITSSAENVLQNLSKNREQKNYITASCNASTNSLIDALINQTQSLLSSTMDTRGQHTAKSQLHVKLKPPSSPPPPPPNGLPIMSNTLPTAETKSILGLSKKSVNKHANETNNIETYYGFDERYLRTFVAQKVALKSVYDDVMGAYKDEHSRPFSYRTNSQTDLQERCKQADLGDITLKDTGDEIYLLPKETGNGNTIERRVATITFKQWQHELKKTLNIPSKNTRNDSFNINTSDNIIHKRISDNNTNNYNINNYSTCTSQHESPAKVAQLNILRKANLCGSELKNIVIAKDTAGNEYLINNTPKKPTQTYAVYIDAYCEDSESATLMNNCSNSGVWAPSSNSLTTSDEEHTNYDYDDDEKTVCEDIRLLENDINLRRCFDFLNNW